MPEPLTAEELEKHRRAIGFDPPVDVVKRLFATIDALEARNKRLREALEEIMCRPHREGISLKRNTIGCTGVCAVARTALEGQDD